MANLEDHYFLGPPPFFPSLAPEDSDGQWHHCRCSGCGELFLVGLGTEDGELIECDGDGCLGQYYFSMNYTGTEDPSVFSSGSIKSIHLPNHQGNHVRN